MLSEARPDLACCGEHFQCDLRIVDPESRRDAERGEIWISSKSVAAGYWGKPELSKETFHARRVLADGSESRSRYLRTGDEGFLENGRLFVAGRLKDLIIVGGKNYYPEDIEVAAQEANRDAIRPGCVAAFADAENDASEEERVVCVFEVRRNAAARLDAAGFEVLAEAVARAVGVASGLRPHRLVVIPERTIPKTTSGKVQRRQTRAKVADGTLDALYDSGGILTPKSGLFDVAALTGSLRETFPWLLGVSTPPAVDDDALRRSDSVASLSAFASDDALAPKPEPPREAEAPLPPAPAGVDEVEAVILEAVREAAPSRVEATTAFHELGLSSRQMVELLRKAEARLDVELPPTVVFSCPTARRPSGISFETTRGPDSRTPRPRRDADGPRAGSRRGRGL